MSVNVSMNCSLARELSRESAPERISHSTFMAAPRPRILFAACASGEPTDALLRAAELTTALDADLHVLRVASGTGHARTKNGKNHLVRATISAERAVTTARRTRAWCDAVLSEKLPSRRVEVRVGDFVEQVVLRANALHAALVVLPPDEGQSGRRVTSVVMEANVPVLVARPHTESETIVAATDLEDSRLPVLHRAAELARRLETDVVLMHNIPPRTEIAAWSSFFTANDGSLFKRLHRMRRAAGELDVESEAVVEQMPSAADAILETARERDADIVVVGTRAKTPFESSRVGSVPGRIVERARRSVLVTPLRATRSVSH